MARPAPTSTVNGPVLRELRIKNGDSKSSLARRAQISLGYLSDIEAGRRTGNPTVIAQLAEALNVPTSVLEAPRQVSS